MGASGGTEAHGSEHTTFGRQRWPTLGYIGAEVGRTRSEFSQFRAERQHRRAVIAADGVGALQLGHIDGRRTPRVIPTSLGVDGTDERGHPRSLDVPHQPHPIEVHGPRNKPAPNICEGKQ